MHAIGARAVPRWRQRASPLCAQAAPPPLTLMAPWLATLVRAGESGGAKGGGGQRAGVAGAGALPAARAHSTPRTPPPPLPSSPPPPPGFDPLNFGANKDALEWYRNAELVHCRWSMLAVAGILIPEVRQ